MSTTTMTNPMINLNIGASLVTGAAPAIAYSTPAIQQAIALVVGAAAGNVGLMVCESFAVTSGTPFTIDLTTATDPLGNAVDMAVCTDIAMINLSNVSGQDMILGGAVTNFIVGACPVAKAQAKLSATVLIGLELTVDSTHKIVEVTVAAGTAVAGQILIFGR